MQQTNMNYDSIFMEVVKQIKVGRTPDLFSSTTVTSSTSANTSTSIRSSAYISGEGTKSDNIRYVNVGRLRRAEGLAVY